MTTTAPRRLYIETQGCQMNVYDSARIQDLLRDQGGFERTDDPAQADVLLLNTCSIREKAQDKVFSELGRWARLKLERPDILIGVGGCVASQEGEAMLARAPYLDVVFGPQTLHRLPDLLAERAATAAPVVDVRFPLIEKFDVLPEPRIEGHKAFVSIMEGCSKYCSFCVVPYTRGEEVSRPVDDILAEVVAIARQGVREVTLLGQNVNGFAGPHHDGSVCGFAELLHLVAAVPGIGRLRYTTSHPVHVDDALIEAHRTLPALAAHVHLPVQSGSDRILTAMKRQHTLATYRDLVRRLQATRPNLLVATDLIVGFPGETDEDFAETLALAEDCDFDHSYSFIYSKRPGTPAAELPDDTPESVKKERLHQLKTLIIRQTGRHTDAMLGRVERVLIDRPSTRYEGMVIGIAENTRWIHFPADTALIGRRLIIQPLDA